MILFILPNLGSGGAQRATANLINTMARNGEEVRLLLLLDQPDVYEIDPRVEISRLASKRFRSTLKLMVKYFKKAKFDRVYTAMWHVNFLTTVALILAGRRPSKYLVASLHNNPELIRRTEGTPFLVDFYYKRILGLARSAICVDEGIKDAIESQYGSRKGKLHVASNIALTEEIFEEIKAERANGTPNDFFAGQKYILWVGRFCYQKNVDLLVEIVKNTEYNFVIVGEGDEEEKLDQIRDLDRVRVLPFQKNIWRLYLDASILILTSRFEGQGLVLIEAMQCGCFPITTDCDYGPRNVIGDTDAGILVPNTSVTAFDEAIASTFEALNDPDKSDDIHRKLQNRAQVFSEKTLFEKYRQIIER